ncbi:isoprenylcysteine carboxyl methyltransferase family protein [Aestuariivirga sp.]|uniref:isoprenylcysteine carboxyl methyltransferase family protein n=1 Tax=Aestuariivirga sp. TaxID=2650926 RepID=UPI0039E39615
MTFAMLLLALVTLSRAGELLLARRNTARLLARGAVEVGAAHYPAIVALHAAWLLALWIYGAFQPVNLVWLAVFLVLQAGRIWTLATLGARWTTRILVVPGETLVRRGPYRFVSHPNYMIVVGEIPVLPLALSLPLVALVFTVLNALVLTVRIRTEQRALQQVSTAHGAL